MKNEQITIRINKDQLKWIERQIDKGEFESRASGVRRCILIAIRVYENATPEELVKFVHGIGEKNVKVNLPL
jgi:Arc/MetJ-type ribon-helix-helix transcriptional regulator